MAALEACSEPAPLLQQDLQGVEGEDEVCHGAASPAATQALAGRRRGAHFAVAVVALLACCVYAAPRMLGSSTAPPRQPHVGDVGGIASLQVEPEDVEPIRKALLGFKEPGKRQKFLVFRCRDGECAGGFGDRLAGLFGAAYLAMSTGRQLKVDWPELFEVFLPKSLGPQPPTSEVDVRFYPLELGISLADKKILEAHEFGNVPNFPDGTFDGLSSDVVVFNAWDGETWYSDHWRKYPSRVSGLAKDYRVVIMSGNRGGTWPWFFTLRDTLHVVPSSCTFWQLYHLIFESMFKPNPAFTHKVVALQVASAQPVFIRKQSLEHAVETLSSASTFSIGVHVRAGDKVSQREANFGFQAENSCEELDPAANYKPRLSCIERLAKEHAAATAKKRVLVIFSDSQCAKQHIMEHFASSSAFEEVWSQEISGTTNIDTSVLAADREACLEHGVDYNGADLRTLHASSAQECQELCKQEAKCVGFTWGGYSDVDQNLCWLKKFGFTTSMKDGLVSGPKSCESAADDGKHAWEQGMKDWTLMRHVDMLALATGYSFISGFAASALITTSVRKDVYDVGSCEKLEHNVVCAGRFC